MKVKQDSVIVIKDATIVKLRKLLLKVNSCVTEYCIAEGLPKDDVPLRVIMRVEQDIDVGTTSLSLEVYHTAYDKLEHQIFAEYIH